MFAETKWCPTFFTFSLETVGYLQERHPNVMTIIRGLFN